MRAHDDSSDQSQLTNSDFLCNELFNTAVSFSLLRSRPSLQRRFCSSQLRLPLSALPSEYSGCRTRQDAEQRHRYSINSRGPWTAVHTNAYVLATEGTLPQRRLNEPALGSGEWVFRQEGFRRNEERCGVSLERSWVSGERMSWGLGPGSAGWRRRVQNEESRKLPRN